MRTSCAALVVVAGLVTASFGQDPKPPQMDRLVVKARLEGVHLAPPDGIVMVLAFTREAEARVLPPSEMHQAEDSLEVTISAERLDVPGFVQVFGQGSNARGGVVVFRDSLRGELDLGKLTFGDAAPVLVSGRVVGPNQKPAFGADVRVRIERAPGQSLLLEQFQTVTDASGAFSIRGEVRGTATGLAIETEGRWTIDRPVEFVPGATNVELVATATAAISGRLDVPPDLSMDDLVVVMKGPPQGTDNAKVDCPSFSHGGTNDRLEFPARSRFKVEGLVPGTYDVRVKFRGASRPLVRLSEVKIDDDTRELPLLQVTDPARRVVVRITVADGSPAAGAKLWVRETGDRGSFRDVKLGENAAAEVVFVGEGAELVARAAGTDYVRLPAAGPEMKLTPAVVAPTPVSVTPPADAPKPSNGTTLVVALEWCAAPDVPRAAVDAVSDDTDPRTEEKYEIAFPESGPAAATIGVPGWYRVSLRARTANGWRGRGVGNVLVAGPDAVAVPVGLTAEEIRMFLDIVFPIPTPQRPR